MSPRATITPSDNSIISSKLDTPSAFSILEMILIFSPPFASNKFLTSRTSCAERTKEAAMKSKSCSIPKRISDLSFSERYSIGIDTPGTLILLRRLNLPPDFTVHTISDPTISFTSNPIKPSSIKISVPTDTASYNFS